MSQDAQKPEEELVPTGWVARYTGFSPSTVRQWRHRGEGPPYLRLSNGFVRYHKRDVIEWAEQFRAET